MHTLQFLAACAGLWTAWRLGRWWAESRRAWDDMHRDWQKRKRYRDPD